MRATSRQFLLAAFLGAFTLAACSGATDSTGSNGAAADSGTAPGLSDGGSSSSDGSVAPGQDSGSTGSKDSGTIVTDSSIPPDPSDGTPQRLTCTGNFGSGLSAMYGRIDGYLVSIVPLGGSHTCNGDSSHVHLQIEMSGSVYDVAVNADTMVAERDMAPPGPAWAEGWHTNDGINYPTLGLHSADFASVGGSSQMAAKIETELANANHVSIYGTGYSTSGAHLIHRNNGHDGAIVIHPLNSTAHIMFFDFTTTTPF